MADPLSSATRKMEAGEFPVASIIPYNLNIARDPESLLYRIKQRTLRRSSSTSPRYIGPRRAVDVRMVVVELGGDGRKSVKLVPLTDDQKLTRAEASFVVIEDLISLSPENVHEFTMKLSTILQSRIFEEHIFSVFDSIANFETLQPEKTPTRTRYRPYKSPTVNDMINFSFPIEQYLSHRESATRINHVIICQFSTGSGTTATLVIEKYKTDWAMHALFKRTEYIDQHNFQLVLFGSVCMDLCSLAVRGWVSTIDALQDVIQEGIDAIATPSLGTERLLEAYDPSIDGCGLSELADMLILAAENLDYLSQFIRENRINPDHLVSSLRPTYSLNELRNQIENLRERTEVLMNISEKLTHRIQVRAQVQSSILAIDAAKLLYISDNTQRGSAYLIVLFLPGIFVSTLLSSGVFGQLTTGTLLTIWLAFALPLTYVTDLLLHWFWKKPIVSQQIKEVLAENEKTSRVMEVVSRHTPRVDLPSLIRSCLGGNRKPPVTKPSTVDRAGA